MTLAGRAIAGKDNESKRKNEVEGLYGVISPSGKNDNSGLDSDGFDR